MHDWHVGQRIVCIDDDLLDARTGVVINPNPNPIVRGSIYTIVKIAGEDPFLRRHGCVAFLLAEVSSIWFTSTCFRPVRKTDISVFEKLLAPGPKVLDPV